MRNISLDSVVVHGNDRTSSLKMQDDGSLKWSMRMLNELPKIFGNADPLHYSQMLPGVQTNNEYDGGIHIQGCDNSHNFVSIGEVPIYNVSHLLGFFSVFNGSHFPDMTLNRNANNAAFPNRLGGTVNMNLPTTVDDSINGEFSLGMISSQGTIHLPIGKNQQLTMSARASYLNLLYSGLLKNEESDLSYSFYDVNATYFWQCNKKNRMVANFYLGNDDATILMPDYALKLRAKWGNRAASLTWMHDNGVLSFQHTLYNTRYKNNFLLDFSAVSTSLPSSIEEFGYRGELRYKTWIYGGSASLYNIKPQEPQLHGEYFSNGLLPSVEKTNSREFTLFANNSIYVNKSFYMGAGIRASIYGINRNNFYSIDPSWCFRYQLSNDWSVKLNYAVRHQYILQTGVSTTGLPIEFWMSTGKDNVRPQYQHSISLSSDGIVLGGKYTISAEIYYKWLFHLYEYQGTMFDFINTKYDISSMLYPGKGKNYGLNILINKKVGKLKGWLSYSLTHAKRKIPGISDLGYFPSGHERLHEFNCVATYSFGKRWTLGSTVVWATGTPYTPVKHYYLSAGNIIADYAERNSQNMTPYFRIDMSANYKFNNNRFKEHGINFSVYNLSYSTNRLFYYMKYYEEQYNYSSVSFLTKILPSISYYCKF